jgi:hypothetical protein
VVITYRKSIAQTPDLSSIIFPDGHNVSFNYTSTEREDLKGAFPLSHIDMSYLGRSLSRYKLNTTYFIRNRYGTPITDFQKRDARLCLKSVQKIGVDLKEEALPYIFDFTQAQILLMILYHLPFFMQKMYGVFTMVLTLRVLMKKISH